jgi:hypothetical protein
MAQVVSTTAVSRQDSNVTQTARQIVGFSFYRLDPAWRRLSASTKRRQADELVNVITRSSKQLMVPPPACSPVASRDAAVRAPRTQAGGGMVLTYSLVGLKPDVDFLIWRVGTSLEQL